jgi:hypothetical protein
MLAHNSSQMFGRRNLRKLFRNGYFERKIRTSPENLRKYDVACILVNIADTKTYKTK